MASTESGFHFRDRETLGWGDGPFGVLLGMEGSGVGDRDRAAPGGVSEDDRVFRSFLFGLCSRRGNAKSKPGLFPLVSQFWELLQCVGDASFSWWELS